MFAGRTLVIATRHRKEQVISPILEASLGVRCIVPPDLDTDRLGTFSGEVERKDDPLTTARAKCAMALAATGADLALASEGSFGPHPQLFFLPSDEEVLLLVDTLNELEVYASHLDTRTNYSGTVIRTEQELRSFAEQVGFPEHGLILRRKKDDPGGLIKGITHADQLDLAFRQLITAQGEVYVETDMRALYNPTRMRVIEQTARKLVDRIQSCCPTCSRPGFGVTDLVRGLPCDWCGGPTQAVLYTRSICSRCHHEVENWYPQGRQVEDPGSCDRCNP